MQFSKPPKPSAKATPVNASIQSDGMPWHVELFKRTYVLERRMLESLRLGPDAAVYRPAKSLDGGLKYNTPEEKEKKNQWQEVYTKVATVAKPNMPMQYVRTLFYALRSSSLATPTLTQLASANNQKIVSDFTKDAFSSLQAKFIADTSRAKSEIFLRTATRQPLAAAVYSTVLDGRLELSPLFRYCLAADTIQKVNDDSKAGVTSGFRLSILEKYLNDLEFLAAFDYTVFPEIYSSVYGSSLPSKFRELAMSLVESARDA